MTMCYVFTLLFCRQMILNDMHAFVICVVATALCIPLYMPSRVVYCFWGFLWNAKNVVYSYVPFLKSIPRFGSVQFNVQSVKYEFT